MKKLGKTAIWVMTILILSKLLGLTREILLAQKFGASYIVDAYTICASVPSVLFTLFIGILTRAYPVAYFRIPEQERNRFFNNVLSLLMALSAALALMCFFGSNVVVKIFAPGFTGRTRELTNSFVRIVAIYLPFFAAYSVIGSQANVLEEFVSDKFCYYIVLNAVVVISIVFADGGHPQVLAYGLDASIIATVVVLMFLLSRNGELKYKPEIRFDDNVKLLLVLSLPLGLSAIIGELNAVIDRAFASSLGEGITSALSYANRLQAVPYTMIVSIVLELCNPRMNQCFANNDTKGGLLYARKSYMVTAFFSIPIVLFLCLFAKPIVQLLFQRGAFDENATITTAKCLALYAIGVPFSMFTVIEARTLAANLQQKMVLRNTIITVATNIILNFILINKLGYVGLPLATSLAAVVSFAEIAIGVIQKSLKSLDKSVIPDCIKIAGLAVLAALVCFGVLAVLQPRIGPNISIVIGIIVAVIMYIGLSFVFHIETAVWLYRSLPEKMQIFD